jgi:hypothetical protein
VHFLFFFNHSFLHKQLSLDLDLISHSKWQLGKWQGEQVTCFLTCRSLWLALAMEKLSFSLLASTSWEMAARHPEGLRCTALETSTQSSSKWHGKSLPYQALWELYREQDHPAKDLTGNSNLNECFKNFF